MRMMAMIQQAPGEFNASLFGALTTGSVAVTIMPL
jgi:hypothetical protein